MKMKKTWLSLCSVIILLPILFAVVMQREVAGAVTIFTVRGTNLRIYQSDSGNFTFARRTKSERLKEPKWLVTRKNKAAWVVVNFGILYIEFPFFVMDQLSSGTEITANKNLHIP